MVPVVDLDVHMNTIAENLAKTLERQTQQIEKSDVIVRARALRGYAVFKETMRDHFSPYKIVAVEPASPMPPPAEQRRRDR